MKQVIAITMQVIFWVALLGMYVIMVKWVIEYDKMVTDCTAREVFEIKGERYVCIMLEKL